jgi:MFS family permease
MGVSSITPAFPTIAGELNLTSKEVNLLIVVFTIPGIFLSPLLGIMADRFGRRKVLIPSILIFSICGTTCAFVSDFNTILILRFFQGAGAASLSSLNQTIIGDVFPGKDRITAMGYNSSVLSLGTMLYPSLGGALALLGWNYPFLLSMAGFPVAYLVATKLNNPEPEKNGKIGQYLSSSIKLMMGKEVLALYFGTLAGFILLYGVMLAFFPYYMHENFKATPFHIGLVTSAASIGSIIGAFNMGRLSRHFSSKKLLVTAFLLYMLSLILSSFAVNMILFIIPVFIYGFANGILIPNIQTRISIIAPAEYRGAFMSINSTVLRLGQTAGPFLSGIILFNQGSSGVFLWAVLFALFTSIVLMIAVPVRGEIDSDK